MYVFQGNGFVPGVPARDLTNQEAKDYDVEGSSLYWKDGLAPAEAQEQWERDEDQQGDESNPGTEHHETDEEIETRLESEGVTNGNGS